MFHRNVGLDSKALPQKPWKGKARPCLSCLLQGGLGRLSTALPKPGSGFLGGGWAGGEREDQDPKT